MTRSSPAALSASCADLLLPAYLKRFHTIYLSLLGASFSPSLVFLILIYNLHIPVGTGFLNQASSRGVGAFLCPADPPTTMFEPGFAEILVSRN